VFGVKKPCIKRIVHTVDRAKSGRPTQLGRPCSTGYQQERPAEIHRGRIGWQDDESTSSEILILASCWPVPVQTICFLSAFRFNLLLLIYCSVISIQQAKRWTNVCELAPEVLMYTCMSSAYRKVEANEFDVPSWLILSSTEAIQVRTSIRQKSSVFGSLKLSADVMDCKQYCASFYSQSCLRFSFPCMNSENHMVCNVERHSVFVSGCFSLFSRNFLHCCQFFKLLVSIPDFNLKCENVLWSLHKMSSAAQIPDWMWCSKWLCCENVFSLPLTIWRNRKFT
jgi:hypothetical protein